MIAFEADGANEEIFRELGQIHGDMRRAIRKAWFALGKDLKKEANTEILRKPRAGRKYFIRGPSGRRRRHVASLPGETHANRTGKLRRSLSWKVHGHESMDFGYGISTRGSNQAPEYDAWVEFGTMLMFARPSLENAIEATQRNAETHFAREMSRVFKVS